MGKLIIVNSEAELPDSADREIQSSFILVKDLGAKETNQEWFNHELEAGHKVPIGAEILAAIRDAAEDIYIIATLGTSSYFDPEVPAVIFDFGVSGFLASAEPKHMTRTIMLFHELGHAVQWITRRAWFMESKSKAERDRTYRNKGYYPEIEQDNLVRHEWPMCKQMGHPSRMHYEDFFDDADKAKERWDVTNTAAIKIQQAWRARQAKKE